MGSSKIRCNIINYRKGFIEVTPLVHEGCINIEAWDVDPDIDISDLDIADEEIPENKITGNTELEMGIEEAEQLIQALQHAINRVKSGDKVA